VGTWASPGCEAYPDGNGGMNYLDRQFKLSANTWSLYGTIYGDPTCGFPLFSFSIDGPYEITGASADHAGAAEATFRITRNDWVAHAQGLADTFSMSGCGAEPWTVGVPQSVLATGCIGVAKAEADCAGGELDLLRLDGDALYFGERSVDLCTTRAPRPNGYAVTRVTDALNIDVAGYFPEGVALQSYLPAYVGSFGTGAITRLSAGDVSETVVQPGGLSGAVIGMKLAGGSLWACVSDLMNPNAAALVKLDPATGAEQARYTLPGGGFCNDLVPDAQGNVYVTESFQGSVFKLTAGGAALEPWASGYTPLPDSAGFSLNGLALSADGAHLLLGRTDSGDIVRVTITAEGAAGEASVEMVDGAPGSIDGLTAWRGHLFAVRSGGVYRLIEGDGGVGAVEAFRAQIDEHDVVVRAAGADAETVVGEARGDGLGVFHDLGGVGFELRLERLAEANGFCRDNVHERATLDAGEDLGVDFFRKLFFAEDDATARAAQGFVGGGGDEIRVREGAWMDTCRD
jgi:sugar lactone lactonase YvrE